MLTTLFSMIAGTLMLVLKAFGIIATGFLLSVGFFTGSIAMLKAVTVMGKKPKEGENGAQQEIPGTTAKSN